MQTVVKQDLESHLPAWVQTLNKLERLAKQQAKKENSGSQSVICQQSQPAQGQDSPEPSPQKKAEVVKIAVD